MSAWFTILLVFGLPLLVLQLGKTIKVIHFIGPVVLSYLVGLALGNLTGPWPTVLLQNDIASLVVPLAIPLLMFHSQPRSWLRVAGRSLLSFGLCAVAVVLAICLAYVALGYQLPEGKVMGAMLSGVYTGGTPNLISIGAVLDAKPETITTLIVMDTVLCGAYLLFLITIAHKVLGLVLPNPTLQATETSEQTVDVRSLPKDMSFGLLLAILCVLIGLLVSFVFTGAWFSEAYVLSGLTLCALLLGMHRRVASLRGTEVLGDYLILVFCVSAGIISDFSAILQQDTNVFWFCLMVVVGTIVIHLLLCRAFSIDVHTFMITSTAALFGPAFIGLVAYRLGNRQLLASGLTTGAIGYAIAFFVGMLVHGILEVIR